MVASSESKGRAGSAAQYTDQRTHAWLAREAACTGRGCCIPSGPVCNAQPDGAAQAVPEQLHAAAETGRRLERACAHTLSIVTRSLYLLLSSQSRALLALSCVVLAQSSPPSLQPCVHRTWARHTLRVCILMCLQHSQLPPRHTLAKHNTPRIAHTRAIGLTHSYPWSPFMEA